MGKLFYKEIDDSTSLTISWYKERPWKFEFRYAYKMCWILIIGKLWIDMDRLPF